jgi:hypothetical protein
MFTAFLTAYDPSDLPGTSVDPLGFDRGYNSLADTILPGLTNVAAYPRYFGLLCAGIQLAVCSSDATPQEKYRAREKSVLALERFWALANVLARPNSSNAVRGVTYAQERLRQVSNDARTDAAFPLLARQAQYGVIGVYGNVAEGMRFLNRSELELTPALGEVAGNAFLEETAIPASLKRAVQQHTEVSIAILKEWGERAHIEALPQSKEGTCIGDGLHSNSVRSRMARLLEKTPYAKDEDELSRLGRIRLKLNGRPSDRDLGEAIACILAYETVYRIIILTFERLLWLCRHQPSLKLATSKLSSDPVLRTAHEELCAAVPKLTLALQAARDGALHLSLERLDDVLRFLVEATKSERLHDGIAAIVRRHTDVQHGKFDRGRRKTAWLERSEEAVSLSMARVGGLSRAVEIPEQIEAHEYRVRSADALIAAAKRGGA